MMIGTISTILAATIVNVAFPALIAEFHVGHDTLQWVAAGFLAATTATMLATAWLVETFGERATFVGTMALFLAASLLAAVSWNVQWLIAARVLQGAAAGILQPLAMIVLFRVFPVEERGRAMALYGFGIVLAPAIGPAIGGALLEAFGWRSIFLLTVPFCLAGLALGPRALPRHVERTSRALRLDRLGAAAWRADHAAECSGVWPSSGFASAHADRARRGRHRARRRVHPLGDAHAERRFCRSGCFATGRSRVLRSSPSPMASGCSERRISFPSSRRRSRVTTLRKPVTCCCRRASRWPSPSRSAGGLPTACNRLRSSSPDSRCSRHRAC